MTPYIRLAAFCLLCLAALLPSGALAQQVAAGGSCATAIQSVLAGISARDLDTSEGPPRNAFIALNPAALAEADRLDRAAASGAAKDPLHCVPIAVKDNFDTADLPSTVGRIAPTN
ncbi:MAG: amidase family protein [Myxococcota bacterium]